jgi:O-antigen ligase
VSPPRRFDPAVRWLPAVIAGVLPLLFIPNSVDAYILPRTAVTVAGAGLLVAGGLIWGRGSLGPLRLPALAVALVAILAAGLSVAPGLSLAGAYSRYESLPVRLAYLGLLCGAAWIGERERTVTAFLAGCAVVAVEALYQAATHALPRPDGNLGQPNLLGALLAMSIPLALHRARSDRRWLPPVALYALALVASTSRSGWLGALAGAVVVGVFWAPARLRWAAAGGAAVLVVLAAAALVLSPLRALNQDTGAGRLGVWRDSLSVIAERPLLGWGEDTMGLVFGRHQSADWEPGHNFDRAHSMPLDLAATQGLAGLAACAWLFATWWRGVWGRPELAGAAGAVAAYLAWSLLNFDWAPATAPLWLLAGAAWPGPSHSTPPLRPWRATSPHPGGRIAAAAGAAAVGLALAVPPVLADMAYYAGQPATASAIDPFQARYWAAVGDLAGLRTAARLGVTEPSTYVALGDAEARAGDGRAAQDAYRRALELYPYDQEARRRLSA